MYKGGGKQEAESKGEMESGRTLIERYTFRFPATSYSRSDRFTTPGLPIEPVDHNWGGKPSKKASTLPRARSTSVPPLPTRLSSPLVPEFEREVRLGQAPHRSGEDGRPSHPMRSVHCSCEVPSSSSTMPRISVPKRARVA